MRKTAKKLDILKSKLKDGVYTVKQARKYRVSPHLLSYYVKNHKLKRLSHGVYAFKDSIGFDYHSLLKEKLICVPQAVIGLESALKVYGLTDEVPHCIQLIVPLSNVPKRKLQDVKFHQMRDDLYKKHINTINNLPVSSLERTIVDLLKFGYSMSFLLSVIKEIKRKKLSINLGKIKRMAKPYRVKGKVSCLMEVI